MEPPSTGTTLGGSPVHAKPDNPMDALHHRLTCLEKDLAALDSRFRQEKNRARDEANLAAKEQNMKIHDNCVSLNELISQQQAALKTDIAQFFEAERERQSIAQNNVGEQLSRVQEGNCSSEQLEVIQELQRRVNEFDQRLGTEKEQMQQKNEEVAAMIRKLQQIGRSASDSLNQCLESLGADRQHSKRLRNHLEHAKEGAATTMTDVEERTLIRLQELVEQLEEQAPEQLALIRFQELVEQIPKLVDQASVSCKNQVEHAIGKLEDDVQKALGDTVSWKNDVHLLGSQLKEVQQHVDQLDQDFAKQLPKLVDQASISCNNQVDRTTEKLEDDVQKALGDTDTVSWKGWKNYLNLLSTQVEDMQQHIDKIDRRLDSEKQQMQQKYEELPATMRTLQQLQQSDSDRLNQVLEVLIESLGVDKQQIQQKEELGLHSSDLYLEVKEKDLGSGRTLLVQELCELLPKLRTPECKNEVAIAIQKLEDDICKKLQDKPSVESMRNFGKHLLEQLQEKLQQYVQEQLQMLGLHKGAQGDTENYETSEHLTQQHSQQDVTAKLNDVWQRTDDLQHNVEDVILNMESLASAIRQKTDDIECRLEAILPKLESDFEKIFYEFWNNFGSVHTAKLMDDLQGRLETKLSQDGENLHILMEERVHTTKMMDDLQGQVEAVAPKIADLQSMVASVEENQKEYFGKISQDADNLHILMEELRRTQAQRQQNSENLHALKEELHQIRAKLNGNQHPSPDQVHSLGKEFEEPIRHPTRSRSGSKDSEVTLHSPHSEEVVKEVIQNSHLDCEGKRDIMDSFLTQEIQRHKQLADEDLQKGLNLVRSELKDELQSLATALGDNVSSLSSIQSLLALESEERRSCFEDLSKFVEGGLQVLSSTFDDALEQRWTCIKKAFQQGKEGSVPCLQSPVGAPRDASMSALSKLLQECARVRSAGVNAVRTINADITSKSTRHATDSTDLSELSTPHFPDSSRGRLSAWTVDQHPPPARSDTRMVDLHQSTTKLSSLRTMLDRKKAAAIHGSKKALSRPPSPAPAIPQLQAIHGVIRSPSPVPTISVRQQGVDIAVGGLRVRSRSPSERMRSLSPPQQIRCVAQNQVQLSISDQIILASEHIIAAVPKAAGMHTPPRQFAVYGSSSAFPSRETYPGSQHYSRSNRSVSPPAPALRWSGDVGRRSLGSPSR